MNFRGTRSAVSSFLPSRSTCCATLLRSMPVAEELLRTAPIIKNARLFLASRVIEAPVTPPALSIPRYAMDALLWQAANMVGVDARSSCEVGAVQGSGPFHLDTPKGSVCAKAVIVAAGRWSKFKTRTVIPGGPKWIGVKGHYRESQTVSINRSVFF